MEQNLKKNKGNIYINQKLQKNKKWFVSFFLLFFMLFSTRLTFCKFNSLFHFAMTLPFITDSYSLPISSPSHLPLIPRIPMTPLISFIHLLKPTQSPSVPLRLPLIPRIPITIIISFTHLRIYPLTLRLPLSPRLSLTFRLPLTPSLTPFTPPTPFPTPTALQ